LNQIKKLGKMSVGNLQMNLKKKMNILKEPSLIDMYYPQLEKSDETFGKGVLTLLT
jgi:hypothetical protein